MNAAEHYAEAVRLLESMKTGDDYCADHKSKPDVPQAGAELAQTGLGNLAAAQVHATLALACTVATAMQPLLVQNQVRSN